jgi:hypothetical protein
VTAVHDYDTFRKLQNVGLNVHALKNAISSWALGTGWTIKTTIDRIPLSFAVADIDEILRWYGNASTINTIDFAGVINFFCCFY